MGGLWGFLIVAVIFGSMGSIVRTAIRSKQRGANDRELAELRERVQQLERLVEQRPALPPQQKQHVDEIDRRVQSLETIVTGADELLERRLRDAAQQIANKE